VSLSEFKAYGHLCGGSLLSESGWILTAGHCIDRIVFARAGLFAINDMSNAQIRQINKKIEHPDENIDIALVKVWEPFYIDGLTVAIIRLPTVDESPKGMLTMYGWGTMADHERANILQVKQGSFQVQCIIKKRYFFY
jgi:secreted trypsin-like serine protease